MIRSALKANPLLGHLAQPLPEIGARRQQKREVEKARGATIRERSRGIVSQFQEDRLADAETLDAGFAFD